MQHFWSGRPLLSMLCVIISCDTLALKKRHTACSLHVMLLFQPILQLVLVLALWHTQCVTHSSNSPQWHSDTCDKANRNPPFSVAGVRQKKGKDIHEYFCVLTCRHIHLHLQQLSNCNPTCIHPTVRRRDSTKPIMDFTKQDILEPHLSRDQLYNLTHQQLR